MTEAPENQGAVEQVMDEASVAKPKERIKRPSKPDDVAHKQKVEALQAVIDKNKKRSEEIKQILDDRRNGRSASSSGQQALKNKLAELRGQFQTLVKQKQHLRAQLDEASKTRDAVRNSLKELKANMKFTTVEQIDDAIARLEDRVQHSTLSLNEEKKILDDIRKLKASRAAVGEYSSKLESLAQDDSTRSELQAEIKSLDDGINKVRAEEDKYRKELAELREKEQEKGNDNSALVAERDQCREVCKQAYEKIKDLRAEHDGVWQEFKAQEKLWREQQNEERARRREELAAQKAARDAERAARLAEMAPEPFEKEITMCNQLAAYLNRFNTAQSQSNDTPQEDAKPVAELDGMKVFSRKEADESDAWLIGGGASGKKNKHKKPATSEANAQSSKIVHSFDMLEAFTTLSIAVPANAAAMASAVPEVEAKKVEYLKKREEAKAAKQAEPENGGNAADMEEGEIVEQQAESSTAAATSSETSGKGKSKPKKSASQDPPKLDDVASWPAVGVGGVVANGVSAVDGTRPSAADVLSKGTAKA